MDVEPPTIEYVKSKVRDIWIQHPKLTFRVCEPGIHQIRRRKGAVNPWRFFFQLGIQSKDPKTKVKIKCLCRS